MRSGARCGAADGLSLTMARRQATAHSWRHQRRKHAGSALIDGLLALGLFSIGMLSLLQLVSTTLVEAMHAQYRSQASLLASALVARMWAGDRSVAALQSRFGSVTSGEYQQWLNAVQADLPGTRIPANQPLVTIDANRRVSITLRWQQPSERTAHELRVQTLIGD